jgi:hypothetical protein
MKRPVYRHDLASVPWYWVDESPIPVAMQKVATSIIVSTETFDDMLPELMAFGFQPQTWAQRAAADLYRYRLGYRLSTAWADFRRRVADTIYSEREHEW